MLEVLLGGEDQEQTLQLLAHPYLRTHLVLVLTRLKPMGVGVEAGHLQRQQDQMAALVVVVLDGVRLQTTLEEVEIRLLQVQVKEIMAVTVYQEMLMQMGAEVEQTLQVEMEPHQERVETVVLEKHLLFLV